MLFILITQDVPTIFDCPTSNQLGKTNIYLSICKGLEQSSTGNEGKHAFYLFLNPR